MIYYIGAINNFYDEFDEIDNKQDYINNYIFSRSSRIFEFKAELIDTTNYESTLVFKILEIISKTDTVKNKVGDIFKCYNYNTEEYNYCGEPEINDGGSMVCGGNYRSLIIPFEEFKIDISPIMFNNKYINIITNKDILGIIDNLDSDYKTKYLNTDEYKFEFTNEINKYTLYKVNKSIGLIINNKFHNLDDNLIDMFEKITFLLLKK